MCTVLILNACVSCMHESCRDHVKTGCKYCELVLLNCGGTRQIAVKMLFVHLSAEISAHRVFRSCAEMFMQPIRYHYTGHVDSDKDFFPRTVTRIFSQSHVEIQ